MNLPSGTVSFVFTDIEGSTRLWERYPDQMREALRRHNDLMQAAVDANHGVVFRTVGDAYCCAFERPTDALAAVVQAQRSLQQEAWAPETVIRVRMAIHVGPVEIDRGDYVAPCLNRLARLLSTAHGEQTVVSQVAFELIRDSLPEDVTLLPLGAHRLKDLSRPETVYQVQTPDTRAVFPPLRSLGNPDLPNNLPEQLTSFVGRVAEVGELERLLTTARLLTVVGPGGVGKTRIALQVGASMLDRYPHGVFVAELAPIDASASVATGVARALRIRDIGQGSVADAVHQFFGERHLLLILDNTEHVIADAARFVDRLLRACPHVCVLATSREPLNIAGEQIYRLAPLSLPPSDSALNSPTPSFLTQFESVRLFIERGLTHRPEFAVTNENAPFVAQICARLDGIPLAIELAAARLRSLCVEEIARRLGERFRLLTGGSRTALPRQQTLRALIDWSYELLPEQERVLLRRLSVFAGGATIADAEQVCADENRLSVLDVLDRTLALTEKSLLIAEESEGVLRYRMLETVRQYAAEKLHDAEETDVVKQRLVDWCVDFCQSHIQGSVSFTPPEWIATISSEYSNLVTGLEAGGRSLFVLAALLWRFWHFRGLLSEGRCWCEKALQVPADAFQDGKPLRAHILIGLGWIAELQGDSASATEWLHEARAIFEEMDDLHGMGHAANILGFVKYNNRDYNSAQKLFTQASEWLTMQGDPAGAGLAVQNLGNIAFRRHDLDAARNYYERGLVLLRSVGDERGMANCISNLSIVVNEQEDYPEAYSLTQEGLALRRKIGDTTGTAISLHNLGMVTKNLGRLDEAKSFLEEAICIRKQMANRRGVASSSHNLGVVLAEQGNTAVARSVFLQSLRIRRDLGDEPDMVETLEEYAGVLAKQNEPLRAARLWALTSVLRGTLDIELSEEEQQALSALISESRKQVPDAEWDAAWESGKTLPLLDAVREVLDTPDIASWIGR